MKQRPLTFLVLLTFLARAWAQQVDVALNVSISGNDASAIQAQSVNSAQVVSELNALAANNFGQFGQFKDALVNSVAESFDSNQVAAQMCPVGSYIDSADGVCKPCRAGTYSTTTLSTTEANCVPCGSGKFSNVSGASSESVCQSCPSGTFSSATGANSSATCQSCGPFMSTTPGASSSSDCVCKDGYYNSNGCQLCPTGSYCTANVREDCPGRTSTPLKSTSNPGGKDITDCYCTPGFYGLASDGCNVCLVNKYCPGVPYTDSSVKNQVDSYDCPLNSGTNQLVGRQSQDQCVCDTSYRRSISTSSTRIYEVTSQQCNCSNAYACPVFCDSSSKCELNDNCVPTTQNPAGQPKFEKTLTCPQGYVMYAQSQPEYSSDYTYTWFLAPPQTSSVTVIISGINTGINILENKYNTLAIHQCRDSTCSAGNVAPLNTQIRGNLGSQVLSYTTTGAYRVIRVQFTVTTGLGSNPPFQLQYSSFLSTCTSPNTVEARLQTVDYYTATPDLYSPTQVETSWPLVAWFGDQLNFISANIPVSVYDSSESSVGGASGSSWTPPAIGVYSLVDLTMPARRRQVHVLPLDARTVNVYYGVTIGAVGSPSSISLSGDYSGGSSPDILLVVGETLVMTRVSGTAGLQILTAYNATSSTYTQLATGVTGQSTSSVAETTLTLSTASLQPGLYYYASASSPGVVPPGRILLYKEAGGLQCLQCFPGEYCYNGNTVKCPPNSYSPPGSIDASNCTCSPGFARSTSDLDNYVSGQTVDSGGRHSCAISSNNTLYCWGAGEAGQLGLGYEAVSGGGVELPTLVPNAFDVKNVSLGSNFTCVVMGSDLRVYCWGSNYFGTLGLDNTGDLVELGEAPIFARLAGVSTSGGFEVPNWYNTHMLSCGDQTCCAVIQQNAASVLDKTVENVGGTVRSLTCWGRGDQNQHGQGASIVTNRRHIGTGDSRSYLQTGILSLSFTSRVVRWVTVGGNQTCALMEDGTVFCWGRNDNGAVGAGTLFGAANYYDPTLVNLGTDRALTVNCFNGVCCVVTRAKYQVKCWGRGAGGRLGVGVFDVGTTTASMGVGLQPVNLGTGVYAMDVNVGGSQTCALLANKKVKCWGLVSGMVVGDSPHAEMADFLPHVNLAGSQVALQISGKGDTTCSVMFDYGVVCWGTSAGSIAKVALPPGVTALRAMGEAGYVYSCSVCAANTYCPGGTSNPAQCPANSASPEQSSRSGDCTCIPGYKFVSGQCTLCTGLVWCFGGIATACTGNTATLQDGASSSAACQCTRGYYRNSGACSSCPAGQYKDYVGNNASCIRCPTGFYSAATTATSNATCKPCAPGSSSAAGSSSCTACWPGTAPAPGGASCVACRPGFYSDGGQSSCLPCAAGKFDSNPGTGVSSDCQDCPDGTSSSALNASSESVCRSCAAGTVSSAGAAQCTACPSGQFSQERVSVCTDCPGNATSAPGSPYARCYCLPGFRKRMLDSVNFVCDVCQPGSYSEGNVSTCPPCPAGTASGEYGLTSPSGCSACPAGRFSPAGSTACRQCAGWSFSSAERAGACTNCSLGFFAAVGATACSACPQSYYSFDPIVDSNGCRECEPGTYCVGPALALENGVPQRQSCPLGTFNNDPRLSSSTQCTPCPANHFCPSPTLKGQCPPGTVSNASSTSQLSCVCQTGFTCSYTKVVNAVVTLKMSAAAFSQNQIVQQEFKNAVARAAKTTADKVTIVRIVDRSGGGGARRRMLSAGGEAHVLLVIHGGSGLGLGRELDRLLEQAGIQAGRERAWIEPHAVEVQKKK
jgi:hypothetical protein